MLYQLLRTTPYLSGQVKHDLILNSSQVIEDLRLAPLADSIPDIYEEGNYNLMNYSHEKNIKHIYNKIKGSFFTNTAKFTGCKFLYNNEVTMDTHDNTYMCGIRRNSLYKKYNRQFSYLVPLWVSEQVDFSNLRFVVKIFGESENIAVVERTFRLDEKLAEYYNNFYQEINDDLISIKMDTNQVFITGVDVQAGNLQTKDVSYVLDELLKRERPILETDYLIESLFQNNHIIARQLLNLNLVFDLYDLVPHDVRRSFTYKPMRIEVLVKNGDKVIELRDLYTNYEHIPVTKLDDNTATTTTDNVFEYLDDDKAIDFVYENKLTQPVFHWALLENPNEVYNLYDGFAPTVDIEGESYRICGHYGSQGDLSKSEYSMWDNNLAWCEYTTEYENLFGAELALKILRESEDKYFSKIDVSKSVIWLNNNKYDVSGINDLVPMKVRMIKTNLDNPNFNIGLDWKKVHTHSEEFIDSNNITHTKWLSIFKREDKNSNDWAICVVGSDNNLMTIKSICDNCSEPTDDVLKSFISILKGYIKPYRVVFNNTITPRVVSRLIEGYSPKEVEYFKTDENFQSYVYRYFGKLIPLFIPPHDRENDESKLKKLRFNYIYKYKQWSDVNSPNIKEYNKLIKNGFLPNYPSVILQGTTDSFYALEKDQFSSQRDIFYNDWEWEIEHYKDNRIYQLFETLEFDMIEKHRTITQESFDKKVLDEFIKVIGLSFDENVIKNYIFSLYEYTFEFDYVSDTNVDEIKYKLKFKLK